MIGCIIQARMGSTRLPGKILKKVDKDIPSLQYTINQLKFSKNIDKIVIATTDLAEDDVIETFVKKQNLDCFRGNAENVLDRYYQCAKKFRFDGIVRITADCPLIDPFITDQVIQVFIDSGCDSVLLMSYATDGAAIMEALLSQGFAGQIFGGQLPPGAIAMAILSFIINFASFLSNSLT